MGIILEEQGEPWDLEIITQGMRFIPLKESLSMYKGDLIFVRRLENGNREELRKVISSFMFESYKKEHDLTDREGLVEMIKASIDPYLPFSNKDLMRNNRKMEKLFCSEIVAESYMRAGLLPDDLGNEFPDSNEYIPADFTSFSPRKNQETILLQNMNNGYKLLQEEFINFDKMKLQELRHHKILFPDK
jgi:hypothetical protein